MRKLAIAVALASTVLATPALARDGSGYVGVEGGAMIVEDFSLDFDDDVDSVDDVLTIDHNTGFDIDAVAGYDFGGFRLEGELGYKRASVDAITVDTAFVPVVSPGPYELDGSVRVLSGMINGLLDVGNDTGLSGFVGAGIGLASVRYNADIDEDIDDFDEGDLDVSESDSGVAWQLLAGVRTALSPNMDLGVKYRLFNVRKLNFGDTDGSLRGRFRSHSLLLSLIYNFAAPPPPPPPPPPPAPATQTCPDGTVILATDVCPAPPPPPPPPPPAPERG